MPTKAKPTARKPVEKVNEKELGPIIGHIPDKQPWYSDWNGSVDELIRAYLASHSVEVECPACYGRANTFARDGADAPRVCPTCHGKKTITILNLGN